MIELLVNGVISVFDKHGIAVAFLVVMIILYVTLLFFFRKAIVCFLDAVKGFREESASQRKECAKEKAIMLELHMAEKKSIIQLHVQTIKTIDDITANLNSKNPRE